MGLWFTVQNSTHSSHFLCWAMFLSSFIVFYKEDFLKFVSELDRAQRKIVSRVWLWNGQVNLAVLCRLLVK